MAKLSKRMSAIREGVDKSKEYAPLDGFALINKFATCKFDESVDVCIHLGIDARKSDQTVRGSVVLPNGTGKTVRVAVFTQGAKAEEAKAAGAEFVGMDDLAEAVKKGEMNFDVVIASPDEVSVVGEICPILLQGGLMIYTKLCTINHGVV